jgi:hypothetical protein
VLFALTAGLGLGLGPACDDTPSGSLRADAAVDAAEDATFDASSTNVTVTTYSTVEFDPAATSNVLFAVVRDGDGPWLPLVGEAGTYRAFVTGPRYSVAVACRAALSDGGSSAEVYIVQTTLSETRDHFFYNCGAAPTTWDESRSAGCECQPAAHAVDALLAGRAVHCRVSDDDRCTSRRSLDHQRGRR